MPGRWIRHVIRAWAVAGFAMHTGLLPSPDEAEAIFLKHRVCRVLRGGACRVALETCVFVRRRRRGCSGVRNELGSDAWGRHVEVPLGGLARQARGEKVAVLVGKPGRLR